MAEPFKTYRTGTGLGISAMLTKFGETAARALGRQLYLEAEGIMAQSKELVPVDTGTLRASGFVLPPVQDGTVMRVELGYGGPAAKINPKTGESSDGYAVYVHENLEAHHPHGMAKFLEIPFDGAKRQMTTRIAAGMKADLATGMQLGPTSGIAQAEPNLESIAKPLNGE